MPEVAPTREQVEEWARSIEGVRVFDMGGSIFGKPEYLQRFAALAFAAGAASRPCTCHPDDNPPKPCPRKYALDECRKAAGADVLTEGEIDTYSARLRLGKSDADVTRETLQTVARIGAERERERAARMCEGLGTQFGEHPEWAATCAAAIRRGEGG
jgi:hypothetical protein